MTKSLLKTVRKGKCGKILLKFFFLWYLFFLICKFSYLLFSFINNLFSISY